MTKTMFEDLPKDILEGFERHIIYKKSKTHPTDRINLGGECVDTENFYDAILYQIKKYRETHDNSLYEQADD